MERIFGNIRKLLPAKNSGFIAVEDSEDDYYFQASHSPNLNYENLKEGQKVAFYAGAASKLGNSFANDVEVVEETSRQETEVQTPIAQHSQSTSLIERLLEVFDEAKICKNPDAFEDSVFVLLRCLGIHNLYQFDRKNQAGKADGFFSIGNLAVMYDCTLRENFEEHKKEQIENYVNKLNNKSQLTIDIKRDDGGVANKVLQISGKTKQVWIISKYKTRELNDYDGIKVKEVSVQDLIKLLKTRLYSSIFEQDELSGKLTLIDR